jgi:hypothetical protein
VRRGFWQIEKYHQLDQQKPRDACVSAGKANCRVSGCACRDRTPRYPSDLTGQQWELLEPEARAVMAELRKGPGGGADDP